MISMAKTMEILSYGENLALNSFFDTKSQFSSNNGWSYKGHFLPLTTTAKMLAKMDEILNKHLYKAGF